MGWRRETLLICSAGDIGLQVWRVLLIFKLQAIGKLGPAWVHFLQGAQLLLGGHVLTFASAFVDLQNCPLENPMSFLVHKRDDFLHSAPAHENAINLYCQAVQPPLVSPERAILAINAADVDDLLGLKLLAAVLEFFAAAAEAAEVPQEARIDAGQIILRRVGIRLRFGHSPIILFCVEPEMGSTMKKSCAAETYRRKCHALLTLLGFSPACDQQSPKQMAVCRFPGFPVKLALSGLQRRPQ